MFRPAAVLLALSLVVAGCNGGDRPAGAAFVMDVAEATFDNTHELVDQLAVDLGDAPTATVAIGVALDRGYSPEQVDAAARTGRLQADGQVATPEASAEAPDGDEHGWISDKPDVAVAAARLVAASVARAQGGSITMADLAASAERDFALVDLTTGARDERVGERGEAVLFMILAAINQRSAGQWTEEMLTEYIVTLLIFPDPTCVQGAYNRMNAQLTMTCGDDSSGSPTDDPADVGDSPPEASGSAPDLLARIPDGAWPGVASLSGWPNTEISDASGELAKSGASITITAHAILAEDLDAGCIALWTIQEDSTGDATVDEVSGTVTIPSERYVHHRSTQGCEFEFDDGEQRDPSQFSLSAANFDGSVLRLDVRGVTWEFDFS